MDQRPDQNTDQKQSNPKQQIIDRLQEATNVLVTVNSNPSVDQLSACIGLTLLLNKLGKHGTAVFSGEVPSTLEFLQPEKTLEHNTDSLRDFIIALDKSKADKLRYKVEESTVKIFITPYRTSLSSDDLNFSHGDFNVDAVVALGVHEQGELDAAITAQGRILHDATIISINNKSESTLGTINWHDDQASSLCEMLADMGEGLKKDYLDPQMATAFLTGIVAETERFGGDNTTPRTMTIAGKLMSAGANQQLVASKLDEPEVEVPDNLEAADQSGEEPPQNDEQAAQPSDNTPDSQPPENDDDGTLRISHPTNGLPDAEGDEDVQYGDESEEPADPISQIHIDEHGNVRRAEEQQAQEALDEASKAAEPSEHPHIETQRHVLPDPAKSENSKDQSMGEDSFLPSGGKDDAFELPPVAQSNVPLLSRDSPPAASATPQPVSKPESQTLSQMENKLNSPHSESKPDDATTGSSGEPPDLHSARDAVAGVVDSLPEQKPRDPEQALSDNPAVPVNENNQPSPASTPPNTPAPSNDNQNSPNWQPPAPLPPTNAPPPVPPPMTPPQPPNSQDNNLSSTNNPFTLPPIA